MKTFRSFLPPLAVASLVALVLSLSIGAPRLRAEEPVPGLIDVKITGSGGKAFLFIPGLATPGSVWDDAVAQNQQEATCYVVTLAGFGGLPPVARREHYLADVRDAIVAYARAHKLDHPLIVGHSLGGDVALDLAAKAPELPGRLVIVDSLPFLAALMMPGVETEADAQKASAAIGKSIGSTSPEVFAQGQKQFIGSMVTSPEKAAAIAALTSKSDPPTVGQAMSELLGRDLRPELPAIKCPVLVLGALADKVEPGTTGEDVEKSYRAQYANLPQVKFQFFEKSRHFIMVDEPAGFQAVLATQLAETGAR